MHVVSMQMHHAIGTMVVVVMCVLRLQTVECVHVKLATYCTVMEYHVLVCWVKISALANELCTT